MTEKLFEAGSCMHEFKLNKPKLLNGVSITSVLCLPSNLDSDNLYLARKIYLDENPNRFTERLFSKFICSIFNQSDIILSLKFGWIDKIFDLYKYLLDMSITRLLEFQTTLNIYHYDNSVQAIRCTFYVVSSFKSCDVSNFLWYKEGFKNDIFFQRLELHSCLLFANLNE